MVGAGTCPRVYGEISKFRWPGYPSASELRRHLKTHKNHAALSSEYVDTLRTFQDLIDAHDKHHLSTGGKAPYGNGKHVPNTESGRGRTTRTIARPSRKAAVQSSGESKKVKFRLFARHDSSGNRVSRGRSLFFKRR